jgi:hypothetical protein
MYAMPLPCHSFPHISVAKVALGCQDVPREPLSQDSRGWDWPCSERTLIGTWNKILPHAIKINKITQYWPTKVCGCLHYAIMFWSSEAAKKILQDHACNWNFVSSTSYSVCSCDMAEEKSMTRKSKTRLDRLDRRCNTRHWAESQIMRNLWSWAESCSEGNICSAVFNDFNAQIWTNPPEVLDNKPLEFRYHWNYKHWDQVRCGPSRPAPLVTVDLCVAKPPKQNHAPICEAMLENDETYDMTPHRLRSCKEVIQCKLDQKHPYFDVPSERLLRLLPLASGKALTDPHAHCITICFKMFRDFRWL